MINSYANEAVNKEAHWGYPNVAGTTNASLSIEYNASKRLGLLYNWIAATGKQSVGNVQGICPTNWHLPTDQEWLDLENEIIKHTSTYSSTTIIGSPLLTTSTPTDPLGSRGTHGLVVIDVCYAPLGNGTSMSTLNGGFAALLAGIGNNKNSQGAASGFNAFSYFWTSSIDSANSLQAWERGFGGPGVVRNVSDQTGLVSVRCKKD